VGLFPKHVRRLPAGQTCEECFRLRSLNAELEARLRISTSALTEAEAKNDTLEATARKLQEEARRVMSDLVIARLSKGGRSAAEDEEFKRFNRTVRSSAIPTERGLTRLLPRALTPSSNSYGTKLRPSKAIGEVYATKHTTRLYCRANQDRLCNGSETESVGSRFLSLRQRRHGSGKGRRQNFVSDLPRFDAV
jgi:hypothetical protein